ncbi:MAG TPA: BON domain-containing protein [Gammaproteobacteria bacterium]|nr:BON domain-containing protein [Gammaproteobacteria bacterium]
MKYLTHRTGGFAAIAFSLLLVACAGNTRQESTGEYIDDSVITAKVKTALATSEDTKARQIAVETFKGRVQLSGFVDSRSEAEAAVRLARDVEGVVEVVNKMSVK